MPRAKAGRLLSRYVLLTKTGQPRRKETAMAKGYTRLSMSDRRCIEESLDQGLSIRRIAALISKSPSTVSREIAANRSARRKRKLAPCKRRNTCSVRSLCGDRCSYYNNRCAQCMHEECRLICAEYDFGVPCRRLEASPHVCNGCKRRSFCGEPCGWDYRAAEADAAAKEARSASRRGIDMDPARAKGVLDAIKDGLSRGMSPYEISQACKDDVPVSESTIYRWTERGYGGLCNMELERKVGFKVRRKRAQGSPSARHPARRSYERFSALGDEDRSRAAEMDTVIGLRSDRRCLLSLYLRNCHLQLFLPLEQKACAEVMRALGMIRGICPNGLFEELFAIVLTDNGAEFADDRGIAKALGEGPGETRLYYCDPMSSSQKGSCEKNHTELRQVLKKGAFSFDDINERDASALMSHVNSNPRRSLYGKCPLEVFSSMAGPRAQEMLDALGVRKVEPGELNLSPGMLNAERAMRGEGAIERLK